MKWDCRSHFENVRVPCLVVVGESDQLTPVESCREVASLLPDAKLKVVPLASHQVMQERHEDVSARSRVAAVL